MKEEINKATQSNRLSLSMIMAKVGAMQVVSLVISMVLSRAIIMGNYSPFGVAFVSAVPKQYTIAAGVGALIGYMLPGSVGGFRYMLAIFAVVVIKWIVSGFFKFGKQATFVALMALCSLLASSFMVLIVDYSLITMVSIFSEALLASAAAYFLYQTYYIMTGTKGISALSSQELSCVIITICIMLIGLSVINIGPIAPARILAIIMVLAAARYGKEIGGAIAGISAGFAMSLTGENMLFLTGAYAFAGLMAGVFSRFNKAGVCAAFILSNAIISITQINNPNILINLYEIFAATVLFLVLPAPISVKCAELFAPAPDLPRTDGLRRAIVSKLRFASSALSDVSQTVDEVSTKLKRIDAPSFDDIFSRVEQSACRNCGMRVMCWETTRGETLETLVDMTKTIRKFNYLPQNEISKDFAKKCCRKHDVTAALSTHFTDFLQKESATTRLDEVRSVVSDQFNGISEMLNDMSKEFEQSESYDIRAAERLDDTLRAIGLNASDIACKIDKYSRMTVEIRVTDLRLGKISKRLLLEEISATCDRDFDVPCITKTADELLITLSECANFKVEFGAAQYTCGKARMCGDAYECFNDGKGRAIMVVSDGMGTGGRAAVDGAMASGLMSRLVKAGFGFDCSLKIVNSAMLFKSTHESLATLDIACIDLFTGATQLLKAGAPATIVRRNGRTGLAECSSMPAGILRDIGFDNASVTLSKNDIVLMMSDGATNDGTNWICAELESWGEGGATALAEHIANGARRRRSDGREDDITVVAAMIERA